MDAPDPRRRRRPAALLAALVGCLTLGLACSPPAPTVVAEPDGPVQATTYPLAFLAERLLGDAHPVLLPVPPGQDPVHWEPPRAALRAMQRARLIVANGAGAEPWLESAAVPRSRLVDTGRDLTERLIEGEARTHRHGPEGEHTHAATRPHTWVDPTLLRLQLGTLAEALGAAFPEAADAIVERRRALDEALRAIQARWSALGPALAERRVLALSDAYAYLGRAHGFEVEVVEADALPLPGAWLLLADGEREAERFAVFAGDGRAVVRVDSLGNRSRADAEEDRDYLALVRRGLDGLEAELGIERP
jgi:zinc transport system substrate-binding protein